MHRHEHVFQCSGIIVLANGIHKSVSISLCEDTTFVNENFEFVSDTRLELTFLSLLHGCTSCQDRNMTNVKTTDSTYLIQMVSHSYQVLSFIAFTFLS